MKEADIECNGWIEGSVCNVGHIHKIYNADNYELSSTNLLITIQTPDGEILETSVYIGGDNIFNEEMTEERAGETVKFGLCKTKLLKIFTFCMLNRCFKLQQSTF